MECRHTASNTHKISLGNPKRVSFFSACFSYAYFFYQVILSPGNRKRSPCATIKKERGLAAPVSWKSPKFWRTDRLFRKASFFENSMRLKGGSCCFEYTTLGKTGLFFRKFKWPKVYDIDSSPVPSNSNFRDAARRSPPFPMSHGARNRKSSMPLDSRCNKVWIPKPSNARPVINGSTLNAQRPIFLKRESPPHVNPCKGLSRYGSICLSPVNAPGMESP